MTRDRLGRLIDWAEKDDDFIPMMLRMSVVFMFVILPGFLLISAAAAGFYYVLFLIVRALWGFMFGGLA